jgi:hypothetical protein
MPYTPPGYDDVGRALSRLALAGGLLSAIVGGERRTRRTAGQAAVR